MLVKVFAAVGLLICLLLAVHMCLGVRQRMRLEAWGRRLVTGLGRHLLWRFNARARRRVAHEAALEAISRARRGDGSQGRSGGYTEPGEWDGNVYRPERFNSKKPTKPH